MKELCTPGLLAAVAVHPAFLSPLSSLSSDQLMCEWEEPFVSAIQRTPRVNPKGLDKQMSTELSFWT